MMDILVARHAEVGSQPGAVDRLYERLIEHDDISLVGYEEVMSRLQDARSRVIVFTQTEGYLGSDFRRWAESVLTHPAAVLVELNTFAQASAFRPQHDRYRMVLLSSDGVYRHRIRAAVLGVRLPGYVGVLPYPLLSATGGGGPSSMTTTELEQHCVVSRVGRADARKWTDFEYELMTRWAESTPSTRFKLLLVGCPKTYPRKPAANLEIHHREYTDDVASIYARTDVYLHHSRIGETFGATIAEAQSSGCRIILALDPRWDCAPLDYLDSETHVLGTTRRIRRLASRGDLPIGRPESSAAAHPFMSPSDWRTLLNQHAAGGRPCSPTMAEALAHVRRQARQLLGQASPRTAAMHQTLRVVLYEAARAANR